MKLIDLALDADFALPQTMRSLFENGRTQYGTSPEEWKATWQSRMLADPPRLFHPVISSG